MVWCVMVKMLEWMDWTGWVIPLRLLWVLEHLKLGLKIAKRDEISWFVKCQSPPPPQLHIAPPRPIASSIDGESKYTAAHPLPIKVQNCQHCKSSCGKTFSEQDNNYSAIIQAFFWLCFIGYQCLLKVFERRARNARHRKPTARAASSPMLSQKLSFDTAIQLE